MLQGKFAANCRLQETELAQRMQVSGAPIREALRVLERECLLKDILSAFRVRSVLEPPLKQR